MTPIIIDAEAVSREGASGAPRNLPARGPNYADLPDLSEAPKRRLHPVVVGMIGFGAATGFFYGTEALAPSAFKPSTIIGGYGHEIAKAHKSGELEAQVRYDAQLRGIEIQFQTQLKQAETAAAQWQEQYRTEMAGVMEDYRGAWSRANIFAQATADLQKQYAQYRLSVTQGSLGGEMGVANMATMLGALGGLLDPSLERDAFAYADRMRGRALSKLDEAARSGITVSVVGWNEGLPDPDALAARIERLPPLQFPQAPRAVTVPALTEPANPKTK